MIPFISELMDLSCMAVVHQQPEQSNLSFFLNFLAEGQIKLVNFLIVCAG